MLGARRKVTRPARLRTCASRSAPSGRGAPSIDPKPILDGWQLLQATEIYRANGTDVLREGPTVGQILLMLQAAAPEARPRRLAHRHLRLRAQRHQGTGSFDRRVLATLAYLAEFGLSPTVTSLRCGHGYFTKSGNVSEHPRATRSTSRRSTASRPWVSRRRRGRGPGGPAAGAAPGHVGPHQVISLLDFGGPTLSMADHADHIHVGFRPAGEAWRRARRIRVLKPSQWPAADVAPERAREPDRPPREGGDTTPPRCRRRGERARRRRASGRSSGARRRSPCRRGDRAVAVAVRARSAWPSG